MAGTGRRLKPEGSRRNRVKPERGEWVTLPSELFDGAPGLPRAGAPRGGWSTPAKKEWSRWWASPMAHMWDETDSSNLEMLLLMIDEWWSNPTAAAFAQIRQMKDSLGLTPKGRQDRRWRLPDGVPDLVEVPPSVTKLADRRKLATDA